MRKQIRKLIKLLKWLWKYETRYFNKNISPNNFLVYSWIHGIDDKDE